MRSLSYLVVLLACLLATLPLELLRGVRVLRRPVRLLATLLAAGAPFVIWDALATAHRQWWFDPAQTLRPRVLGLPLEELGFFVVIPLAIILTREAVGALRADSQDLTQRQPGARR